MGEEVAKQLRSDVIKKPSLWQMALLFASMSIVCCSFLVGSVILFLKGHPVAGTAFLMLGFFTTPNIHLTDKHL